MGGKGSGRPVTAQCGTSGAYQRHLKNNETPCNACKEFINAYSRSRHRQLYKPRSRTRKNLSYEDAKAYVNAEKRIVGLCCGIDWRGDKCTEQVFVGNEHHFDWDHIEDRKEAGGKQLSELIKSASKAEIDDEIAKCQLLCKFCHSDKSLKNSGKGNSVKVDALQEVELRLFDDC